MLPEKLWFDISLDWEILGDKFDNVSSDTIPDNTLQALDFYVFILGYYEKKVLRFIDITNKPELAIDFGQIDNSEPITDFQDEKARKVLERTAK